MPSFPWGEIATKARGYLYSAVFDRQNFPELQGVRALKNHNLLLAWNYCIQSTVSLS